MISGPHQRPPRHACGGDGVLVAHEGRPCWPVDEPDESRRRGRQQLPRCPETAKPPAQTTRARRFRTWGSRHGSTTVRASEPTTIATDKQRSRLLGLGSNRWRNGHLAAGVNPPIFHTRKEVVNTRPPEFANPTGCSPANNSMPSARSRSPMCRSPIAADPRNSSTGRDSRNESHSRSSERPPEPRAQRLHSQNGALRQRIFMRTPVVGR
jgi:hypothetical protein